MLKQSYEVEVLINGKPAKEYAHKGKVHIEGRQGTRFSIRMRNNSYSRKLFVPTIDGLSIMNGEEGSFDSSGYIVGGHSSITIDGWRTSDKEVAEFFFSSPEGSYRKKMNKGDNLGVIGCAVFSEVFNPPFYISNSGGQTITFPGQDWPQWTTTTCDTASLSSTTGTSVFNMQTRGSSMDNVKAMCCSANLGSQPTQQLGTGWGDQKTSEVTSVTFDRVSSPDATFEIYYNSREELQKAGISFKKEPLYVVPQAFPGQYCKPPRDN